MTTTPMEIPETTTEPDNKTFYFVPEWIVADSGAILQVTAICKIEYRTPPAGTGVPFSRVSMNDGSSHRFNNVRFSVQDAGYILWDKVSTPPEAEGCKQ